MYMMMTMMKRGERRGEEGRGREGTGGEEKGKGGEGKGRGTERKGRRGGIVPMLLGGTDAPALPQKWGTPLNIWRRKSTGSESKTLCNDVASAQSSWQQNQLFLAIGYFYLIQQTSSYPLLCGRWP